jgi:3',5'-cyclic AMP phosphodiesterase CpdA
MKILVISDVIKWKGYEKIVDENQPDVIILAGDLTSDGFASFWISKVSEYEIYPWLKHILPKPPLVFQSFLSLRRIPEISINHVSNR